MNRIDLIGVVGNNLRFRRFEMFDHGDQVVTMFNSVHQEFGLFSCSFEPSLAGLMLVVRV